MRGPNSATRRGRVFDQVHTQLALRRYRQLRAPTGSGAYALQAFAETEHQARAVYAALPALQRWGLLPLGPLPPGEHHGHHHHRDHARRYGRRAPRPPPGTPGLQRLDPL
jgi:hypothetical protein